MVDLARGEGGVAEDVWVAVGGVEAAAGRDAVGRVIHTAEPTGVVIHATAAQLEIDIRRRRISLSVKNAHVKSNTSLNSQQPFCFLLKRSI